METECPDGVFCEKDYWQHNLSLAQKAVEYALQQLQRIEERDERQN